MASRGAGCWEPASWGPWSRWMTCAGRRTQPRRRSRGWSCSRGARSVCSGSRACGACCCGAGIRSGTWACACTTGRRTAARWQFWDGSCRRCMRRGGPARVRVCRGCRPCRGRMRTTRRGSGGGWRKHRSDRRWLGGGLTCRVRPRFWSCRWTGGGAQTVRGRRVGCRSCCLRRWCPVSPRSRAGRV